MTTEKQEKGVALTVMAENFGHEMSAGLLRLWLGMLEPYPAAMVREAVRMVVERYEYKTMPPFAVVRKALDELAGISDKALRLQAEAEWGVLLEAIRRTGRYGDPLALNLDPTTLYVVRMLGGWEQVCNWETSRLDFKRKEFVELWVNAHGKAEAMALGAGAVRVLLSNRDSGPLAVRELSRNMLSRLKALDAGESR